MVARGFSQPLSAEEIDRYASKLYELKPDRTVEAYKALLANDNGQPHFHGQCHQILR
jgi:hypothetical protein